MRSVVMSALPFSSQVLVTFSSPSQMDFSLGNHPPWKGITGPRVRVGQSRVYPEWTRGVTEHPLCKPFIFRYSSTTLSVDFSFHLP